MTTKDIIKHIHEMEKVGTIMSILLLRLARLSDQRDQEQAKEIIDAWDNLCF